MTNEGVVREELREPEHLGGLNGRKLAVHDIVGKCCLARIGFVCVGRVQVAKTSGLPSVVCDCSSQESFLIHFALIGRRTPTIFKGSWR